MNQQSALSILAGENLEPDRRVLFNGTNWMYADANEPHQAVTLQYIASGYRGAARAYNDPGIHAIESATTLSAGGNAYAADDGKVTSTTTGLFVGVVMEAPLAANNPAGIMAVPGSGGGEVLLFSLTTPQTSDGTVTTEVFYTGYTIPANTVKAGDVYRLKAAFTVANSNGTDTCAVKIYFGPDLINTLAAVDEVNADIAVVDAEIVIRTIGANGTAIAVLHTQVDVDAAGDPVIARIEQEFTIDTTAAINVRASSTWTGGHADDDMRLDVFTLTRLRKGV